MPSVVYSRTYYNCIASYSSKCFLNRETRTEGGGSLVFYKLHATSSRKVHSFLSYFQVNGKDVSQSSHDEAVEAFLQAEEPITVEVLRRAQSPRNGPQQQQDSQQDHNCSSMPERPQHSSNSIAVQTEVALGVADIGIEEDVDDEEDDIDSNDHDIGDEEDILVPDLDYEVSRGNCDCGPGFGLAPFFRGCCCCGCCG